MTSAPAQPEVGRTAANVRHQPQSCDANRRNNKGTATRMPQMHGAAHAQTRGRGKWPATRADTAERARAALAAEPSHQAGLHHARRSRQAPTSTKRAMLSKILRTKGGWNRWDVKTEGCLLPQSGGSGIASTESEQSGHTCDISAKRWIRTHR
jgi:hypothetical protein